MSDFYTCNGTKQKKYLKERRGQELNDEKQQEVVDKQLAEQFGLEEQATAFTRLAKRVVSQIGESPVPDILKSSVNAPTVSIKDKLGSLIKSGTLSTWFDKISKITNTKGLSKAAKVVLGDIKNPETRSQITEAFNDKANEIINQLGNIDSSVYEIEKAFTNIVAGGNTGALQELLASSSEAPTASSTAASFVEDIPVLKDFKGTIETILGKTETPKPIALFDKNKGAVLKYNEDYGIELTLDKNGPFFTKIPLTSVGKKSALRKNDQTLNRKLKDIDVARFRTDLTKIK